jgi:transcriptional regulator with XRE-family HTH domain
MNEFLTANQVVSWRLRQARHERGWTQAEAALRLGENLGVYWSIPSFSTAEGSRKSKRIKQFSADEILAMSLTFEKPVWWFFLVRKTPAAPDQPLEVHMPYPRGASLESEELFDFATFGKLDHNDLKELALYASEKFPDMVLELDSGKRGSVANARRSLREFFDHLGR